MEKLRHSLHNEQKNSSAEGQMQVFITPHRDFFPSHTLLSTIVPSCGDICCLPFVALLLATRYYSPLVTVHSLLQSLFYILGIAHHVEPT